MSKWVKPSGIVMDINDIADKYAESLGWTKEGEGLSLEDMTKDQLKVYAKERFKVDLDLNKTRPVLFEQVKALEDDNGN